MVIFIRNIEKALGSKKKLSKSERPNINLVRKIVANKNIKIGEIITMDKIAIKRVNEKGLEPNKLNLILNKKSKKNYEKNKTI